MAEKKCNFIHLGKVQLRIKIGNQNGERKKQVHKIYFHFRIKQDSTFFPPSCFIRLKQQRRITRFKAIKKMDSSRETFMVPRKHGELIKIHGIPNTTQFSSRHLYLRKENLNSHFVLLN